MGMDTTLSNRDETNEMDSKTIVVVVKDGCGGERAVKLSGKQRAALEWLMEDWNLTKAAEFAGVCRQTVSEWVNRDEDFMAVISAWRNEVRTVNQLKLVGATEAAVATVVGAIRERGIAYCRFPIAYLGRVVA
jgi:hypothetical protein